ncbi:hypothetical protein FBU31_001405 [Coemansia sp. 'formosensis']|nr:hypothetical protein FBU31_001405 [Coemansia sp. 'formosensis']
MELLEKPKKRVAVIGSGLAGLSTAYFLQQGGFVVELFERGASAGMDVASVDVDGHRVDVPFRVFTPDYYPCLAALYAHLGIATAAADYSLAFSRADGSTLWSYTNASVGDFQVPIPDSVSGAEERAIARDWTRLLFASACAVRTPHGLRAGGPLDVGMGRYLAEHRYGDVFTAGVLLPFLASVFTCSLAAAAAYPANAVLHFVAKAAFGARLRKARAGVSDVCRRLLQGQTHVHYNAPVARITKDLTVVLESGDERQFDAVVVATPADTARALVAEAAPALGRALAAIEYEDACVVTHRDPGVMPRDAGAWRGVNIAGGGARAQATHWLNYVEETSTGRAFATPLFQTVDPRPKCGGRVGAAGFHRSLLSVASQRAVDDIHQAQGPQVWAVGAYAAPGVPLLEGCVRSAADVAVGLGARLPVAVPLLRRMGADGSSYDVGLAPGMARGEAVGAYYERDAAGTFDFQRPGVGVLSRDPGRWARMWLAWLVFASIPAFAATLAAADTVLAAALGPRAARRVQMGVLDALLYMVCTLCLAIRRVSRHIS